MPREAEWVQMEVKKGISASIVARVFPWKHLETPLETLGNTQGNTWKHFGKHLETFRETLWALLHL